ncbi:MAG: outer membrane beta-barrel protein [Pseudobdellovibrio sp.]
MRNLLVLTTLLVMVAHANAVTPSNSSTLTPAQKRDQQLAAELAKEVDAEESATPKAQPAQKAQTSSQIAAAQPAAQVTPTESIDDQAVANEVAQADIQQTTQIKSEKQSKNNMYLMAALGTIMYPDVGNITGKYAATVAYGYTFSSNIILELGGSFAQYNMDALSPTVFNRHDNYDITQYSIFLAAKYKMAFGKIVPNAGVLVASTTRNFTQLDPNHIGNDGITADRGSSTSTDGGVTAGVDYEMSRDYAIGLDMKYLTNMSTKAQATSNINATSSTGYTVTPIEKLQNFSVGVSGRINF